jgi:hypothetical protein
VAALLVERSKLCQYYFSIFENADYTGEADNEVRKTKVRAFFRSYSCSRWTKNTGPRIRYRCSPSGILGAEATYSSAACRRQPNAFRMTRCEPA